MFAKHDLFCVVIGGMALACGNGNNQAGNDSSNTASSSSGGSSGRGSANNSGGRSAASGTTSSENDDRAGGRASVGDASSIKGTSSSANGTSTTLANGTSSATDVNANGGTRATSATRTSAVSRGGSDVDRSLTSGSSTGGVIATGKTESTTTSASVGGSAATSTSGTSRWPQCFADDKVPTTELKQRAPASDYETQVAVGGVAMIIGSNRQSCLTDSLVRTDVEDLNAQLVDVVETLKFPGFLDWKRGYYLNWVILNSGIPGATLSGQGGHQGDRYGHMNFESTEECPCNWGTGDNSNRGNALHEAIHALQGELWAFNNQASGWIHEAHNCYLGTQRAYVVEGKYTMGWGAALALQMPHVPIESMGLLTDDSVAGPADQGANGKSYVNSIVRYGLEIFFLSLNLEMGRGFVNCLWIDGSKAGNPDQRRSGTLSVFQALQGYAGEEGVAHAVMSFASRSAILDFAGWTDVVRSTLKSNWNDKYWFYTFPSGDGTTAFQPPTKQIPHHQGRNVIPIKLSTGSTSLTVEFNPDPKGSKGTAASLQAQLVYRDESDQPVYGPVFSSGENTTQIPNGARNGIVNLVVAVTNANASSGGDDGSNKGFDAQEHFNYQARIVAGGTIAPNTTRPW